MPSPPITSSESVPPPSRAASARSTISMHRSRASAQVEVWKTRRLTPGIPVSRAPVTLGSSRPARPPPADGFTTRLRADPS